MSSTETSPSERQRPAASVCVLARKDLTHNTRITRLAGSLEQAGHAVTVVSIRPPDARLAGRTPGTRYISVAVEPNLITWLRRDTVRRWLGATARKREPRRSVRRRLAGVTWHPVLSGIARMTGLMPADRTLDRAWVRENGTHATLLQMARSVAPLLVTRDFTAKASAVVNDRRFDLVIAHDSMALRAGWRVARRCRCPLLYDAVEIPDDRSGWSLQNMPAWVLRTEAFFDARIIRRCARIVTVSNGLADWMVRRYRIARPALIRNCRHFVEIRPDDRIRRDTGLGDGDRLALYLNSLYPGQGLEQLIDSIGYLPDNIHVATLGPVTKPDYADALLRQAREAGTVHRFHVLPPKPPDEMLQYAAGADIGVVPRQNTSFNNYISLPNRIFELTMSRLPIAAPSLPDMKRFVEEYGVGISFDETDPRDIARVVAEMLEPGRLAGFRARMEEVARELCWEREGARFVAIASEAMA